jgi:hypothetical protein
MKTFIQILLISFATLTLVANNVVFQYIEKSSLVAFDDQDEEEGKSEKNNSEEKVKEYFSSVFNTTIQSFIVNSKANYLITNTNKLPSISMDVELLPPNFS